MPVFFFTVEQQERAIVERFGKFVRVAGPGLQRKSPFVEKVAGRMSLQVEQLNADIETKTRDNVFVVVKLAIQYMVSADEDKVKDAFYKLDDPEVQMKSYAFDVVRSHIPTMDLDEAYADADTIAKHIQDTLQTQMADYGYEIIKALITNIEPDQRVKDAMNNINAARRNQEAATAQGEGDKTLRIKKAEAESESMRLHGEGVAAERVAIAQGLKDSLAVLADEQGIDPKEAMGLVALTQYMDTIRSVGENGNMTTLLLPHSPASVGSLMDQVQQGMLTGNLAADTVTGGGNGARPHACRPRRPRSPNPGVRSGGKHPAALTETMVDDRQGMVAFLGVDPDPRLLDEDRLQSPSDRATSRAGRATHKHDRLVAAGSLLTGVTLVGGVALASTACWQLLLNGGGAFDAVLAVIGILLAGTHWGWVHVAEYVGLTIDDREQRAPMRGDGSGWPASSRTLASASQPACSTTPRYVSSVSCIGRS